ncbi:MAG: TonB-dependent receptor plug domain-containing protein, partial [Gemmatimonadales bacterium]
MRRLWISLALALALGTATAQAQTRPISGTVVEEGSGSPIFGAQVHVKGTATGTSTRENGSFTLQAPARDIVLEVRSIGFTPIEVTVPAQTATATITMKRDALKLNQVVVTGQASEVSRRNLANSVASVSAEDLTKVSTQSVDDALQGKIAGATLSTSTGAPGGGTRLQIRGISSILGSAQPLFVVDGVIVSDVAIGSGTNMLTHASGSVISYDAEEAPDNRIADLNPNDIESVEVLKGSAASAIYGSKASGGVILITTKRGQSGSPKFNLQTGLGTSVLAYHNNSRKFQSLADAITAFGPN